MVGSVPDYAQVFLHMPVAQLITRARVIVDCSLAFARMFAAAREQLLHCNSRVLYPTQTDFDTTGERVRQILSAQGWFTDSRVMRRANGSLFWVRVEGYTRHRDDPYHETLWVFREASARVAIPDFATPSAIARQRMTARERDVAALLVQNLTAKEIGKALGISHRTVEIHRSRLMKKFEADSTRTLIAHLLL